jgi:hypothetical protein
MKRKSWISLSLKDSWVLEYMTQINGRNIACVNNMKCLGYTCNTRTAWGHAHIHKNTQLKHSYQTHFVHETLTTSILAHVCLNWQHCSAYKPISPQYWQFWQAREPREMQAALKIPYDYNCITGLCREEAEIIHVQLGKQKHKRLGFGRGSSLRSFKWLSFRRG